MQKYSSRCRLFHHTWFEVKCRLGNIKPKAIPPEMFAVLCKNNSHPSQISWPWYFALIKEALPMVYILRKGNHEKGEGYIYSLNVYEVNCDQMWYFFFFFFAKDCLTLNKQTNNHEHCSDSQRILFSFLTLHLVYLRTL